MVKLSAEERERLEAMICACKHPAQSPTKARILLKADVSEAGEGWSDSAISAALDTSIYRPHPASTGRRGDRGGADPQIQSELRPSAN